MKYVKFISTSCMQNNVKYAHPDLIFVRNIRHFRIIEIFEKNVKLKENRPNHMVLFVDVDVHVILAIRLFASWTTGTMGTCGGLWTPRLAPRTRPTQARGVCVCVLLCIINQILVGNSVECLYCKLTFRKRWLTITTTRQPQPRG